MKLRNKKTGRVCNAIVRERKNSNGTYSVIVCTVTKHGIGSVLAEYRSLAGLNEDWEDYKSSEPLIKDEKIRKAVRAWAEAEDEDCYYGEDAKTIYNGSGDNIEFWSEPFENLEKDRHYTITELCGEEEE